MNIEERIKQYLEERNKEVDVMKIAEDLLSKVCDFQDQFPKKKVQGFVLRNNSGFFEIAIQLKGEEERACSACGEPYHTPVLNHVKEILESCGVTCSDVEIGKIFEAHY